MIQPPEPVQRFLEEPGIHLILNLDLTIAYIGPGYQRETGIPESAMGRLVFTVLPGMEILRPSFEKVLHTDETDKPGIVQYNIPSNVGIRERWWDVANIPVPQGGKPKYIVHRAENVTPIIKAQQAVRRQSIKSHTLYGILAAIVVIGAIIFSNQQNEQSRQSNSLKVLIVKNCKGSKVGIQLFDQLNGALYEQRRLLYHSKAVFFNDPKDANAEIVFLNKYAAIWNKLPLSSTRQSNCNGK